jgi:hypothetical protein
MSRTPAALSVKIINQGLVASRHKSRRGGGGVTRNRRGARNSQGVTQRRIKPSRSCSVTELTA